jgi:excisionase family DNA binding protein
VSGAAPISRWTPATQLPAMLAPHEAARWLGIGRSHMYELLRTGRIESVRYGRLIRIRREVLISGEPGEATR